MYRLVERADGDSGGGMRVPEKAAEIRKPWKAVLKERICAIALVKKGIIK
jgi:hypothetical protein